MLIIEPKDILGWCFTVASLVFGVFGFLYSTYAMAMSQAPAAAPITRYLRQFCWVLAAILTVLTVLAIVTSYIAGVDISTWVIVLSFLVLTIFSVRLAFRME